MASILVFCSSSAHVSPMFFSEMELFAEAMARGGHSLVYGGAQVGLMGHMADHVLKHGGEVTGVIPTYLNYEGMVHDKLTNTHVVSGLMDRKRTMIELSDIIVAFPGGIGTVDEVSEALALRQLGEIKQKVIFYNFLDYWKPLIEYFESMKLQKMVSHSFDDLFSVYDNCDDVIEAISKGEYKNEF